MRSEVGLIGRQGGASERRRKERPRELSLEANRADMSSSIHSDKESGSPKAVNGVDIRRTVDFALTVKTVGVFGAEGVSGATVVGVSFLKTWHPSFECVMETGEWVVVANGAEADVEGGYRTAAWPMDSRRKRPVVVLGGERGICLLTIVGSGSQDNE